MPLELLLFKQSQDVADFHLMLVPIPSVLSNQVTQGLVSTQHAHPIKPSQDALQRETEYHLRLVISNMVSSFKMIPIVIVFPHPGRVHARPAVLKRLPVSIWIVSMRIYLHGLQIWLDNVQLVILW